MNEKRKYTTEEVRPEAFAGYDAGCRYRGVILRRNDNLRGFLGHWSAVAGNDKDGTFKVMQCRRMRDLIEEVDQWAQNYTQHSFFVHAEGTASDEEDEGVQGVYEVLIELADPIAWEKITPASRTAFASDVLDSFHAHQGIEVLDDFSISVRAASGEVLQDTMAPDIALAVKNVTYYGKVDEKLFEVAGFGFNGGDDSTDDRIVWVSAFHPAEVEAAIRGHLAVLHGEVPVSHQPEYQLPADRQRLQEKLKTYF